jgi:von Willebrand factor type A domain
MALAPSVPPSAAVEVPNPTTLPATPSLFPECVTTGTIETSLRPANLLFVIDRSASMNCNLPPVTLSAECEQMPEKRDAALPSKWDVVRTTLKQTLAQLPSNARVGLTYFSNDDACGVQSQPSVPIRALDERHVASLTGSLDAVTPLGGTPLVGGLILAYKHLNPDQNPDLPDGDRFAVLLTDGQEGCAADQTQRLLDVELPKAKTASITTFVIGVPGSEVARGFLSRLAFAGGTPTHPNCDRSSPDPSVGDCQFDMTRDPDLASGLTRALAAIGNRALRCEFDVPRPTNGEELDYEAVNIVYTPEPQAAEQVIKQDTTSPCAEGANGWQYTSDRSKIVLCGQACDTVRRAASIRIALGCKSVGVLL